ncbi:hypothetical protein [Microbulbifer thermotolerans]|uniref:hypothetical protein n=1 Tax=Microbulbifer thermotolerans TaxID=252514 RepID=UPI002248CAD8|nr:hypothetical protein [Microbulbifer thermotolerans]MCX2781282.1 hypothetical protein [Microbulbifer thermotolerans]MCX2796477.1 hypothetical protein [Microbulbifer thermotolerans]MCX2806644.1 hypothetical protein [Microbulbifer thermotolerans]MCX2806656.1 hypothetical protein [Microbulbifer thermotolerans]MCX2833098.1 hypothetical protein [Microbulbifer thermotolerans]
MKAVTFMLVIFSGLSFLETALAWRFLGLCLSIVGIIAVYKKSLFIGVEEQLSTLKVKGAPAVLLGVLMLVLGLLIAFEPSTVYNMFGLCEGSCEKTLR